MEQIFREISEGLGRFSKLIFSFPAVKGEKLPQKISLQTAQSKDENPLYYAEELIAEKCFHRSLSREDTVPYLQSRTEECRFRQINLFSEEGEISYRISKKGKISRSCSK